jgi:hypothetical protein
MDHAAPRSERAAAKRKELLEVGDLEERLADRHRAGPEPAGDAGDAGLAGMMAAAAAGAAAAGAPLGMVVPAAVPDVDGGETAQQWTKPSPIGVAAGYSSRQMSIRSGQRS